MLAAGILKSASQLRNNQVDDAISTLSELTANNPNQIDSLINTSTIEVIRGNFNAALWQLTKATMLDPFDYRSYYNLFVIYVKLQNYGKALQNLKKCLSLLYTMQIIYKLRQDPLPTLNRSIFLWAQNTASYSLKAIYLILGNRLEQASDVVKQAIDRCILKHHIFAISCIIDSKLNRQIQRNNNAKDYYAHLLKPLLIQQLHHVQQQNRTVGQDKRQQSGVSDVSSDQDKQFIYRIKIQEIIGEFNQVVKQSQIGNFAHYSDEHVIANMHTLREKVKSGQNIMKQEHRQSDHSKTAPQMQISVVYMGVNKPTSINIQSEISTMLGVCDLTVIKQENDNEINLENQQQEKHKSKINTNIDANNKINVEQNVDATTSDQNLAIKQQQLVNEEVFNDQIQVQSIIGADHIKIQQVENKQQNKSNIDVSQAKLNKLQIQPSDNANKQSKFNEQVELLNQIERRQQQQRTKVQYNKQQLDVKKEENNIQNNQNKQKQSKPQQPKKIEQIKQAPVQPQKQEDKKVQIQQTQIKQENASQIQNKDKTIENKIQKQQNIIQTVPVQTPKKQQNAELQFISPSNNNPTQQIPSSDKKQVSPAKEQQLLYPISHPNFEVKLVQADLQISQQQAGKLQPYVYYEYGQQKHKTTIAMNKGTKKLKWENQIKTFAIQRNPTKMRVSIYSREMFRWDDLVGEARLEIIKTGVHLVPVYLKGKQTGEVTILISKAN